MKRKHRLPNFIPFSAAEINILRSRRAQIGRIHSPVGIEPLTMPQFNSLAGPALHADLHHPCKVLAHIKHILAFGRLADGHRPNFGKHLHRLGDRGLQQRLNLLPSD